MARWIAISLLVSAFLFSPAANAFDVIDRKTTYVESRYLTLGAGLGFVDFARQSGIDGDLGFGFRLSAGHHFNRYLSAEMYYQFSTFRFSSPDPIDPSLSLNTRAAMNQEVFRMIFTYPAVLVQPYVHAGFGGYNLVGVNQETALSFPIQFEIPVGAGFRSYLYRNRISLDLDFTYHFFFGENQDASTLALLGLNRVAFDSYTLMTSVSFHLF